MINITGATELLQAQQSTFEALEETIQELQDQLEAERAKIAALSDQGMLTAEELKASSDSEFEISMLEKAIALAEEKKVNIQKENGPLVYHDALTILREYQVSIKDKHLADFAKIRQKEEEIKALQETIKQSEREEISKMKSFVSQVSPYLPEFFYTGDGSQRTDATPVTFLGSIAWPRTLRGNDFLKSTLFNRGGNN